MSDRQTSGLGFVGQSVERVEDERLLVGRGEYVADVQPDGVLHAAFLRSPAAHATIRSVDVTAARRHPGVVAVHTAAEINETTHPFPPFVMLPGLYTPLYHPMTEDKARFVGDLLAMVVAESRYVAEDALELIDVELDALPAVNSIDDAVAPTSTPIWELAGSNVLMDAVESYGDVDDVFAAADRVITETFRGHRVSNQPMEARGIVVEVDPESGHLDVTATTQAPHMLKWGLAGLTGRRSTRDAFRAFWANRDRRRAFFAQAKQFMASNKESMQRQDNTGMKAQLAKDRSLLKHVGAAAVGLLAADDFPTVRASDIGGGFGSKGPVDREYVAVTAAALLLGRSVQWIEDRSENLLDGGQAHEEDFTVSVAVDADGTFRGLKLDLVIDQGAYPGFPISASGTKALMKVYFPGLYRWEAFECRSRIVASNKGKHIPYRGPWANETWARERMIDVVARELGLSPSEIRLRNMFGAEDFPRRMITGPTLDETASTKKTLERAVELIDFDQLERDKADARERGHRLGIGMACYHEAAPGPPDFIDSVNPGSDMFLTEDARATIGADGSIEVYTSQMPHGQSHQTTFAQVAADEFGVPLDQVRIVWGNTDTTRFSFLGTGGSRGGPIGGGVVRTTTRQLRQQVVEQAARMLEASVDDIDIVDGNIHVAGVPSRGLTYREVAEAAVTERGLQDDGAAFSAVGSYAGKGDGGWSCATHVAIVDIDLGTGMVTIPRYLVVEDCGPIINPKIVDGQIRGGVAQGIGKVFYERTHYDESGNPTTGTYMDYLIPTACEIPEIEIDHLETLSPGENDFRGVGEGGMLGAPGALTNAVSDALAELGVQVTEGHLPPFRILELAGVIPPAGSDPTSPGV